MGKRFTFIAAHFQAIQRRVGRCSQPGLKDGRTVEQQVREGLTALLEADFDLAKKVVETDSV